MYTKNGKYIPIDHKINQHFPFSFITKLKFGPSKSYLNFWYENTDTIWQPWLLLSSETFIPSEVKKKHGNNSPGEEKLPKNIVFQFFF
jgi:hypothetical protein